MPKIRRMRPFLSPIFSFFKTWKSLFQGSSIDNLLTVVNGRHHLKNSADFAEIWHGKYIIHTNIA